MTDQEKKRLKMMWIIELGRLRIVLQADVHPNMEEGVGGAVLGGAVPGDADKLHGVDAVRAAHGAPGQPAGGDHKRDRDRHRAGLHNTVLGLLRRQEEADEGADGAAA